MKTKHFFLGANTYKGLVNYFDTIDGKYTYILKGTPGCGKNTLLKSVAKHFEDAGARVDYVHCSFDPESLDAIYLAEKDVYVVDGTSPHVMDSKNDGTDEIVNLVDFIEISSEDHVTIAKLADKKKKYFEKARKAHERAFMAHKELEQVYAKYLDFEKITGKGEELISKIAKLDF